MPYLFPVPLFDKTSPKNIPTPKKCQTQIQKFPNKSKKGAEDPMLE
jgi:hypothetical protein